MIMSRFFDKFQEKVENIKKYFENLHLARVEAENDKKCRPQFLLDFGFLVSIKMRNV